MGIGIEELLERRISRRELLAGSGRAGIVATGLATLPIHAARPRRGQPRIAIVGSGIAGLSAALTLADRGIRSTIYEAAGRVGGRMHTDTSGYWGDGHHTEWCGELIDSDMTTIRALCRRFGLKLLDLKRLRPPGSLDTYYFFGRYYRHKQALSDFLPVFRAAQRDLRAAGPVTTYRFSTPAARRLDRMTVYEWIETRVPGGHASPMGRLLDVAYTEEMGADTREQPALGLVQELGSGQTRHLSLYGDSDERFRIQGGSELLPRAIAADLPRGTVELGKRLTAVRQSSRGVELRFGRDRVMADYAILTLPFAVLRTLDCSGAGFDPLKRRTIDQLGIGHNSKLMLEFSSRLWDRPGPWGRSDGISYSDRGYLTTWDATLGQPGQTGILVDYTGGTVARSYRPRRPYSSAGDDPLIAGYARRLLHQLEPVFPGIESRWNGRATLSTPFRDPNLRLSYSLLKLGQTSTICGYEIVPQRRIYFAGEHCSVDFRGYVEGGAATGVAAARRILRRL
jgi:monoamine oxidase